MAAKLRLGFEPRWAADRLQCYGALHGVHGAAKSHRHAVTGRLENAAPRRATSGSKPSLRRAFRTASVDLVQLHEPAEADHASGEDRGETALGAFFSHASEMPLDNAEAVTPADHGRTSGELQRGQRAHCGLSSLMVRRPRQGDPVRDRTDPNASRSRTALWPSAHVEVCRVAWRRSTSRLSAGAGWVSWA